VRGWELALRQFGSRSLAHLLQPFPVGSLFKNPALAKTYRLLAEHGAPVFYRGEIARALVDTVRAPPDLKGETPAGGREVLLADEIPLPQPVSGG
jgi:gamma-glutamyltranspeptidase